ncbi:MAG: hypothetical protein ABI690_20750 [Chloroflexota bacterium]
MKLKRFSWIFLIALLTIFPAAAQDSSAPVIDATNIRQLQSIAQINFADLSEEAGVVDKGWFALSANGNRLVVMNRQNVLVTLNNMGQVLDVIAVISGKIRLSSIDAVFSSDGELHASLQVENGKYQVNWRWIGNNLGEQHIVDSLDVPIRLWFDDVDTKIWLEILSGDSTEMAYVTQIIPSSMELYSSMGREIANADVITLPSGPENDPDSFMRIGRIDPPRAITATKEALLKLWNLETGEVTAAVQLDSLPAAGQVNSDGSSFAWVDQKFASLHLLNFETGEDQVIAPLGGTYIPFLLLSAKSDVIIGVNVGLEPDVVAWDISTGERIDLGKYRTCNRQPDLVRLSKDGSTLVIGCDSGLDIWRVPETP